MKWLFLGFVCAMLTACTSVHSVKPYYTDNNKIDVPKDFLGVWISDDEPSQIIHLQLLASGELTVQEFDSAKKDQAKITKLKLQFFKVGGKTYADAYLAELPGEPLGLAAAMTVFPVHALVMVSSDENRFTAVVPQLPDDIPAELPYVTYEETPGKSDKAILFTASGEQWEKILKEKPELFFAKKEKGRTFKKVYVQ